MALGASAQNRMRGAFTPSKYSLLRNKDVQSDLKLSDDQIKKVGDVQSKQMEEMRTMRENMQASGGPPDMATIQAAFKKMNDTYNPQYEAVLTSDQKARLDQLFIQSRKSAALADPDVQTKLGLSDDQKAKIKDLMDKEGEANRSLFEKFRNQEITQEDMQPIMQKNRETLNTELAKVLTDDQNAKFKDMQGAPFAGKFDQGGFGRRGGGR